MPSHIGNVSIRYKTTTEALNKIAGSADLPQSLREVLADASTMADLLNAIPDCPKLDPDTWQDVLISLSYRLLGFSSLNDQHKCDLASRLWHTALLTFMTTCFPQFGRRRFLPNTLLSTLLKNILQETRLDGSRQTTQLRLWMMVIGDVSLFDEADRPWLLPELQAAIQTLGVRDFSALHDVLRLFPWLDITHGSSAERLWECVSKSALARPVSERALTM